MAIQVGGTTVIDDSRNLTNVGGLKTVNSTSILGSGNIDASTSTSYGAVGTYTLAYVPEGGTYGTQYDSAPGGTYSGASIKTMGGGFSGFAAYYDPGTVSFQGVNSSPSGTWRNMMRRRYFAYNQGHWLGLFVRIS